MNLFAVQRDRELLQVLTAVAEVWREGAGPPAEREICHRWVNARHRQLFGTSFHQSRLARLAELGILTHGDSARGGDRRYYLLNNSEQVLALVRQPALA